MIPKLKIIYILPHLGKGGAEELIVKLAADISKVAKVNILLFYKLVEAREHIKKLPENISVEYCFNKELSFLGWRRKALQVLFYLFSPLLFMVYYIKFNINKFDVVHINLTLPSLYMCGFKVISKLLGSQEKYVQTFHTNSHLLKGLSKHINKTSWRFSDIFVYEIYKEDIEYFSKFLEITKIKYIPFGYCSLESGDKSNFLSKGKYEKLLDKVKNRKVFMTVSRIRFFEKKIDVMIDAMRLYKQYNNDFVFIIGGDGEDMNIARTMVVSQGLEDNVVFLGYIDNMELLVRHADVYIVAVVGNSMGVSGMQALSHGTPVVGVQTLPNFISSTDSNIKQSMSDQGLCKILMDLGDRDNYLEYKGVVRDISHLNSKHDEKFSASYLSVYKECLKR